MNFLSSEKKHRSLNNNVGVPRTIPGPERNNLHSATPAPNPVAKPRQNARKDGKKRLTKADIGTPQNFKHISHVGWDPNKGFDVAIFEDPQLKEFFLKVS